jgi:hypothetical protein
MAPPQLLGQSVYHSEAGSHGSSNARLCRWLTIRLLGYLGNDGSLTACRPARWTVGIRCRPRRADTVAHDGPGCRGDAHRYAIRRGVGNERVLRACRPSDAIIDVDRGPWIGPGRHVHSVGPNRLANEMHCEPAAASGERRAEPRHTSTIPIEFPVLWTPPVPAGVSALSVSADGL